MEEKNPKKPKKRFDWKKLLVPLVVVERLLVVIEHFHHLFF
ncbi:hypothetical protein [Phaeodactylibacter xiamenensis]|nr:hypothetical protein [Phaeodactylibacter xiamenensis]